MEYPSLSTPPSGSIRFNTDSKKMEIYNGEQWWEIDSTSPEAQTGGTRGIMAGGATLPSWGGINTISYITISTTGNSQDFGDMTEKGYGMGASSRTRMVRFGGYVDPGTIVNTIGYITISSTGDEIDYADLTDARGAGVAWSNSTRALIAGGYFPSTPDPQNRTNSIEYFTIASSANAIDFGDLWDQTRYCGSVGNPTRMLIYGGQTDNPATVTNTINFVTISTTGNSADFGDLTAAYWGSWAGGGVSNAVRGCISGVGGASPAFGNTIDYVTTASLGNAAEFGDLTAARGYGERETQLCSPTRGVFYGGYTAPTYNTTLDYIEIMTTGNAVDFGDISYNNIGYVATGSNGHGGLG